MNNARRDVDQDRDTRGVTGMNEAPVKPGRKKTERAKRRLEKERVSGGAGARRLAGCFILLFCYFDGARG